MLSIKEIVASYGMQPVLNGLSMSIPKGCLASLVGPSGCGKTTLLRAIGGFEPVKRGAIEIAGRTVSAADLKVPPEQRGVGIVFQDHVLFPHLNVAANITFGLSRFTTAERQARLSELLEAVSLQGLAHRYPHELSGGQQQRVALARALAPQPSVLLLDEPFASLDQRMRTSLAAEVRDVLVRTGTTAVLVTHDIDEAFAFADQVGVLWEGRLAQWGTPAELYRRPAERCVAEFVGRGAFVRGRVENANRLTTDLGAIHCEQACRYAVGTPVDIYLRAEDIVPAERGGITATVRQRRFRGSKILYTLLTEAVNNLVSHFPAHCKHEPGDQVQVRLAVQDPVYFVS